MRDRTAKYLSAFHAAVFRLSRGHVGKRLVDNDMLLLTTTGRRSGRRHTVPLLFLREGTSLVVIASWGGRPSNPDWYENLLAHPEATVQLPGDKPYRAQARTATAEERAAWWPRVVAAYEGYAVYQSRTEREIPVVFLA